MTPPEELLEGRLAPVAAREREEAASARKADEGPAVWSVER